MFSLFPSKFFKPFISSSKQQREAVQGKNEFAFRFEEKDNEFLDIALLDKGKIKGGIDTDRISTEEDQLAGKTHMDLYESEADISVSEMIRFQKSVPRAASARDKKKVTLQRKLDNVRAGTYCKNLEQVSLHQSTYDDDVLDSFEENMYDPKLFRKLKVDKKRTKSYVLCKTNKL
ncbi:unnamed protein product [Kluyveromyces dobzhanskii CBS 2104]|uniref:WGS project CCBQ000000000 data, contig 00104 n=1 Tax=Kluyveromyces dobzhanskii CBS 2104 TaxID=1427455 RepID=A0A0A8L610_9SACH|nr:unnamed protein product [Kluyveromyces dobzhanskii CBS 2104]